MCYGNIIYIRNILNNHIYFWHCSKMVFLFCVTGAIRKKNPNQAYKMKGQHCLELF